MSKADQTVKWEDAYPFIDPYINASGIHVWQFNPLCPVDVRFWTFARQSDIRMNRHEYFEILFLKSGELTFQVQDRFWTVGEGDLFVIGGNLFHRVSGHSRPRARAAHLFFLPDAVCPAGLVGEDAQYLMPFLVQDTDFAHVVSRRTGIPAEIFVLMKRIRAELGGTSACDRLFVRAYLHVILALLVKHYAAYRGSEYHYGHRRRDLARLQSVFDFIDEHFHEPILLEDAASIVHMSKTHFTRFFKHATGQSFVSYLHRFRIAKARALLSSTNKTIAEVSQEVGFGNQSYFGVVFRKLMRVSAREYRTQALLEDHRPAIALPHALNSG